MTNPCYKCEDRHQGCHAKCGKYAEWDAARSKARKAQTKYNEANDFLIRSIFKTRRKP